MKIVHGQDDETRTATAAAAEFLKAALAGAPMPATEVGRMAQEHGLTAKAIRMGREALGVEIARSGFGPGGRSLWSLPPGRHIDAPPPGPCFREDCRGLASDEVSASRKGPTMSETHQTPAKTLPLSERDLRRLANDHRERMAAHAGRGFDPAALERELRAMLAAEVPPERIEAEFARVTKYRQTHTREGFEVIDWWPPNGTCAHCGEDGLVALVKSPLEGVPDVVQAPAENASPRDRRR
jgi:hypothetical protein